MRTQLTRSYSGLALIVLFLLTTTLSCKKKDTLPSPGPNQVFLENVSYNPTTLTVTTGTTVTWENKDNVDHTVTSDTKLFDSQSLSPGGTFTFTFPTAGTYGYHCQIHSQMKATIVVQ